MNHRLLDGTPAQCDPDGDFPCCDDARGDGTCGNEHFQCYCPQCEDYKLLRDWEESGGTLMWRHDGLCGKGNYLPDDTLAECDPDGEKPCCFNLEHDFGGECSGVSTSHCACPACVDYRLVKRVMQAQQDGNCALLRLDSGFLKYVCLDDSSKRLHYKCINSDSNYTPLYTAEIKVKLRGVSNVCKNDPSVYQACGFYRARTTNTEVLCGGYLCDQPGKRQGKYIECTGDHCRAENRDCDTSHSTRDTTLCNDMCDSYYCEDESNCNGY